MALLDILAGTTEGINRGITRERQAMYTRFKEEQAKRQYDDAIAHRDKVFDENVRQFGIRTALEKSRLSDQLKTNEQTRNLRRSQEGREVERHGEWRDLAPYRKEGIKLGIDSLRQGIDIRGKEEDRAAERHGEWVEFKPYRKRETELGIDSLEQGIDIRGNEDRRAGERHDEWLRLAPKREEQIDLGIDSLRQQVEGTTPLTRYQSRYLDYLDRALEGKRTDDSGFKDPTFFQQRDIATEEGILNQMGKYMRKHTGKHWIFGWDVDEPLNRPKKEVIDPKTGERTFVEDERDSISKAFSNMGGDMFMSLKDEFNQNPSLAYNRLTTLLQSFFRTDHGAEMLGKLRKKLPGHSDGQIIEEMKKIFLQGARERAIGDAWKQINEAGKSPVDIQLDTKVR